MISEEELSAKLWQDGYIATYRNDLFLKSEQDLQEMVFVEIEQLFHYHDVRVGGKDEAL